MYWLAWITGVSIYVAVGGFAVYMTYREHQLNGDRNFFLNGASYLLCAVWPLLAVGMLAFALWHPAKFVPAEQN